MHDPIQWRDPYEAMMSRAHRIFDSVAGAALPKAEAAASDPHLPRQPAELYGDALAELLTSAEQAARQAAISLAYREGHGASAEADGGAASDDFRSLTGGEAVRRLIANRLVDASAAGDENFRKRVEDAMRRKLGWKARPKGKAPTASPGAVAELAGKRQLSRPMSLNADTAAGNWCRNCGILLAPIGEHCCEPCLNRHGATYLEEVIAGDREPQHVRLAEEVLEQARQQALDLSRERRLRPR
jgi:hypothetical protein